ncbi:hypothetical protein HY839_00870 [Candidatus Azambacteria bacterium]|nr:hypothetical protein [Candidatus Azambacteria bacterium]
MTDTKNLIAACITAHMHVLGPVAALALARKIASLTIADNGDVLAIADNPEAALEELKNAYLSFAQEASRAILRALAQKHPPLP